MNRFIKELIKPSLKCERVGHKYKTRKEVIRKESRDYVCEDFYCEISKCRRCGYQKVPEKLIQKNGYHSVSMPSGDWDELRENGYMVV